MGNHLCFPSISQKQERKLMRKGWTCEVWSHIENKWLHADITNATKTDVDVEYEYSDGSIGYKGVPRYSAKIQNIKLPVFNNQHTEMSARYRHGSVKRSYKPPLFPTFTPKPICSEDQRAITLCVGLVSAKSGSKESFGTATVFDYDEKTGNVFAITSAYNLLDVDEKTWEKSTSLRFKCWTRDTYEITHNEPERVCHEEPEHVCHEYECNKFVPYGNCKFLNEKDRNDLLIIVFNDKENRYDFKNNVLLQNVATQKLNDISEETEQTCADIELPTANVNIQSSKNIDCEYYVHYKMFGYEKNGVLKELIGRYTEDEENKDFEFKKTCQDEQFMFTHDDVVTDAVEGSAIIIEYQRDKYGIFGICTGYEDNNNVKEHWAVALNDKKIRWIDHVRQNIHQYDTVEDIMKHLRFPPEK
eukprot:187159_1